MSHPIPIAAGPLALVGLVLARGLGRIAMRAERPGRRLVEGDAARPDDILQ
jgi:hypothetical protein